MSMDEKGIRQMPLTYTTHEKISLRNNPDLNEAWLHERICDDPSVLGLGDVRVLDHERTYTNAGRLDILLYDEDNNRRYEVEVMLGATDPSHIIRTIEYWDLERRRYPGYDHVAVLIAEEVTTRFLNVMSLLAGSIPLMAIQLDALKVREQLILNFVQVLDQTDMRVDDTVEDSGGGQKDRAYWDQRVGSSLMKVCDQVLAMINEAASVPQEMNYLRGYIGLRSRNGSVRNFITFGPKRTKKFVHLYFLNDNAASWQQKFDAADVTVHAYRKRRLRISVTPQELNTHADLIKELVVDTVRQFES